MKDRFYYEYLASKWLDGRITQQEKDEFSAWYAMLNQEELQVPASFAKNEEELNRRMFEHITKKIHPVHQLPQPRKVSTTVWVGLAASLLLIALISALWKSSYSAKESLHAHSVVEPGGPKALLTLSNGSVIDLDSIVNGSFVEDDGIIIEKDTDGQLIYRLASGGTDAATYAFNTISTPRGGEYKIVLPDGSRVWLNAASSLRYPLIFNADRREVELLEGEAYFEINKSIRSQKNIPFIVHAQEQELEVLGTRFNINTYLHTQVFTTLIEGSVKAGFKQSTQRQFLKPGQQLHLNAKSNTTSISDVSLDPILAWKDGLFYFENASLEVVLDEFSRWYDIDIEIKDKTKKYNFFGKIPRNTNLSTALAILRTTGVDYKIEKRKLIIY